MSITPIVRCFVTLSIKPLKLIRSCGHRIDGRRFHSTLILFCPLFCVELSVKDFFFKLMAQPRIFIVIKLSRISIVNPLGPLIIGYFTLDNAQ